MPDVPTLDPAALLVADVIRRAAEELLTEGLDAQSAARLIGVSTSKFHAMNAAGHVPAPAELGDRCPRWSRGELVAWFRAGAPSRARWNAMRDVFLRRAG